jgi:hypothetical protein
VGKQAKMKAARKAGRLTVDAGLMRETAEVASHLHDDAYPNVPGQLEHCDFCMALKPVEQLPSLPCADFELLGVIVNRVLVHVCRCHTLAKLESSAGVIASSQVYQGAWTACPDCRRDIDAERWEDVTRRSLKNQTIQPDDLPVAERRNILEGLQAMFRAHQLPGDWQPYKPA